MNRLVAPAIFCALAATSAAGAAQGPARAQGEQALPTLFSDQDYPSAALRNNEQGPVGFRLSIDAQGRPSGCSVTSSSGSPTLDSTTCRLLLERARFRPALDRQGHATSDEYNGRIVWSLGEPMPPGIQAASTLWTNCVLGEASKLAPGPLPASE